MRPNAIQSPKEAEAEAEAEAIKSLKVDYTLRIRPAFVGAGYNVNGDLPVDLVVDDTNREVDGCGSPGLVMVTLGLAKEPMDCLRMFALAHESGHAVAYLACEKASKIAPNPVNGEEKKRHEHLADLIGMRVLMDNLRPVAEDVISNLNKLSNWLGYENEDHPSGKQRTKLISRLHIEGVVHFNDLIDWVLTKNVNEI